MSIMWAESITPRIIFSAARAGTIFQPRKSHPWPGPECHNSPLGEKNSHKSLKLAALSTSHTFTNDTIKVLGVLILRSKLVIFRENAFEKEDTLINAGCYFMLLPLV